MMDACNLYFYLRSCFCEDGYAVETMNPPHNGLRPICSRRFWMGALPATLTSPLRNNNTHSSSISSLPDPPLVLPEVRGSTQEYF